MPVTANLALYPTAGCCHLANLIARFQNHCCLFWKSCELWWWLQPFSRNKQTRNKVTNIVANTSEQKQCLWDDDRVHSAVAWLKCTEAVSGNFFSTLEQYTLWHSSRHLHHFTQLSTEIKSTPAIIFHGYCKSGRVTQISLRKPLEIIR